MGYKDDVSAARARLSEATKAYAAAVREAERGEKQARKQYEKNVKDAEKALDACEKSWQKPLAAIGGLRLFATRVANASGSLSILDDVDVRVDASGNVYSTTEVTSTGGGVSIPGAVVGGLLGGTTGAIIGGRKKNKVESTSEKHDERKLFVTVTTNDGQLIEEVNADKEKDAREFAAKVINQSKVARDAAERHEQDVARLSEAVQAARDDTSAVEAAAASAQAAREDTAARDEEQRKLDEVLASGTEEEIAALQQEERKKRRMLVGALAAVAAVLLVFMAFTTHVICFHKWSDATCEDPEICSVCGRTRGERLGHEWMQATCTEPQVCHRCNQTKGEPLGHSVEEWVTVKEASCTEEGSEEGVCTRCGETLTQTIEKTDHSYGKWTVTKEATCTEEGTRERTCKVCGKKKSGTIEKKDHTPGDWEIVKNFSVSQFGTVTPGVKARKCTVCGKELETQEYTIELTTGQRNALGSAMSYLDFTAFSYQGLVEQLEFEGYSHEDAVFAVDHCGADWNEQAAKSAENYLSFMSFSRQGLIDQLIFEGFTQEQAEYGASSVGY